MAESKSVREYDRFIVRLPDGLKDRLASRAAANNRSMNSEIVDLLETGINEQAVNDLRSLIEEYERISRQRKLLAASVMEVDDRQRAVLLSIKAIAAGDMAGDFSDDLKAKAAALVSHIDEELAGGGSRLIEKGLRA